MSDIPIGRPSSCPPDQGFVHPDLEATQPGQQVRGGAFLRLGSLNRRLWGSAAGRRGRAVPPLFSVRLAGRHRRARRGSRGRRVFVTGWLFCARVLMGTLFRSGRSPLG